MHGPDLLVQVYNSISHSDRLTVVPSFYFYFRVAGQGKSRTPRSTSASSGPSFVHGPKNSKVPLIPYREFSLPTTTLQLISLNDREIGLRDFANPMVACFVPHNSPKSDASQR
jgi:hypothetical protein